MELLRGVSAGMDEEFMFILDSRAGMPLAAVRSLGCIILIFCDRLGLNSFCPLLHPMLWEGGCMRTWVNQGLVLGAAK